LFVFKYYNSKNIVKEPRIAYANTSSKANPSLLVRGVNSYTSHSKSQFPKTANGA